MAEVEAKINGRAYKIACDDGQERHLLSLVGYVNRHVENLKTNFGQVGDAKLLLMASVIIADELSDVRRHVVSLEAEVQRMRLAHENSVERLRNARSTEVDIINSTAARIEALIGQLNKKQV
ncbi:MAG: cell division protein ZapA [Alphaproteobacteria bacterium]|nr:cell division protein ZapA [Alphaproteobacteria bacterium]